PFAGALMLAVGGDATTSRLAEALAVNPWLSVTIAPTVCAPRASAGDCDREPWPAGVPSSVQKIRLSRSPSVGSVALAVKMTCGPLGPIHGTTWPAVGLWRVSVGNDSGTQAVSAFDQYVETAVSRTTVDVPNGNGLCRQMSPISLSDHA